MLFVLLVLGSLTSAHSITGIGPVNGDIIFEPIDELKSKISLVAVLNYVDINEFRQNLLECSCTLMLYEGRPSARVKPLIVSPFKLVKNKLKTPIRFPKAGFYTLVVLGKPKPNKKLPSFILTAEFNVE